MRAIDQGRACRVGPRLVEVGAVDGRPGAVQHAGAGAGVFFVVVADPAQVELLAGLVQQLPAKALACAAVEGVAVVLVLDVAVAAPLISVLNNVDVAIVAQPDAIRDALYRQAFGPVRWVETIQKMASLNMTHIVECGPGKVLAGMVKRISPDLNGHALFDPTSLQEVKTNILG